ncbi:porin [Alcaligenaceae bacterium]|nr:porin [Alcaligenaceae bacterium]
MKKTLLAAALTIGFAGVAQAETSVTLYGILDGGIGYNRITGTTNRGNVPETAGQNLDGKIFGMINGVQSGNRWGLKGSEDLGGGLRAVFQLESGFDLGRGTQAQSNDKNDRLFGRQATLGLASDSWGQFDLGRQTNITSKYLASIDPFAAGFDQANIGAAFTAANTARYDNMVMYQSPGFSGFQLGVGYSFNADGGQFADRDIVDPVTGAVVGNTKDLNKKAITSGLRYANGPINTALTYEQVKSGFTGSTNGDNVTIKSWNLAGSYDFEVVKLALAFGQTRNGLFQSQYNLATTPYFGMEGLKVNSYLVGLTAPIGAGKVLASWTMADPRSNPDNTPGQSYEKQQTYSLGYTYDLSKRTNVYAIGSYAKHVDFLPDAKSTLIGVGLRHQF